MKKKSSFGILVRAIRSYSLITISEARAQLKSPLFDAFFISK